MNQTEWTEFCERLKQAGELMDDARTPRDARTQAEGYRYLTRLLRAGLESCVEGSDPRFPVFYSLSHDTVKIGNDNPDNYYLNCCVSSEYDYLIEGEFGEVTHFSLAVKSGSYATTGDMRPTGELTSETIKRDLNGRFQIIVSANQPADKSANWLAMQANSDNLIIRQYCNARRERPAQFTISCINAGIAPALNPPRFVENLRRVAGFVENTSTLFNQWINQFKAHPNQLPANDQEVCIRAGGNADIHYHNSYWQIAEDEALLVQPERIPSCRAWNFQLSNYWMESLDYRHYPIVYNQDSAVPDKNGRVTMVVAHQNPGENYPNWLSTTGHTQGGMLFRWIEADEFPPIHTRVIKFSELQDLSA